jgi:adenine-specific DNA-methyltransferase
VNRRHPTLFPIEPAPSQVGEHAESLCQYLTPEWAADALVSQFFGDLTAADLVLEPACGRGAFVKAIPDEVEVVGVELDPRLAAEARENTGRRIICGDFRTVRLDVEPTVMVGNPPFNVRLLDEFLARAQGLLPPDGRCGFILSTYMVQTPTTVLRWNESWSLRQHILPRTLFPRAIRPLVFVTFTKDRLRRMLGGFALYREAADVNDLRRAAKLLLVHGRPRVNCWRALVEWGLRRLGGRGRLQDLYATIEPHRHTPNEWWREKVRQTLQRYFVSVERGVWALASTAEVAA